MESSYLVQFGSIKEFLKCRNTDIKIEAQFAFEISDEVRFEYLVENEDKRVPVSRIEELPSKSRFKLFIEGI